jgi:hypothetical protein
MLWGFPVGDSIAHTLLMQLLRYNHIEMMFHARADMGSRVGLAVAITAYI